uniref:Retrovirus-related Env polyprotein from copia-like transposable element 17.6 n=1 Tax=Bactrocera dorsalis TaxID=27457 RepID=A0A034WTS5_BACDO
MWTVIALMTQHCNGTINLTEIKEQNGFIDLQIRDQAIPKDSDIVLHIIDIQQLENIINAMTDNVILMKLENKEILQRELLDTRNKLLTLTTVRDRNKRGLVNAIGSMSKWLFGTMDEDDRQNIQTYFLKTNDSINEQIRINDYFSSAIEHLKEIVKSDRVKIERELNSINKFIYEEYKQTLI